MTSRDLNMTTTPYTPEMEEAALARQNETDAGIGVEDNGGADTGAQGDPPQGRVEPEASERKTIQKSPSDVKRDAIAARFKPDGNDETAFDGDLSRAENLYGDAAREQLEPEPGADPIVGEQIEKPTPAPVKRKLKVLGQVVEMTDDEILAAASKTLAADTYLEDARNLLAEAKAIKAERTGRDPQNPEGQSSTQDDGQDTTRTDGSQNPEDDLEAVVDQLQFGDRKEAAKLLGQTIQKVAGKIATDSHRTRLFNNDLARSQRALDDFKVANPELASDENAGKVIEGEMYKLYREDFVALGIKEEQIPSDPRTLANYHRLLKIDGHAVRSTPDLLNKAKENFVAWRGTSPKPTQQAPRKEAPRVEINVDRDARRAAIPLQPTRAVAPRRDAVLIPKTNSDSDVVKAMRRARGQPVAG